MHLTVGTPPPITFLNLKNPIQLKSHLLMASLLVMVSIVLFNAAVLRLFEASRTALKQRGVRRPILGRPRQRLLGWKG